MLNVEIQKYLKLIFNSATFKDEHLEFLTKRTNLLSCFNCTAILEKKITYT